MSTLPPESARTHLDELCNRTVAALTQRLARAARDLRPPACDHDFLIPLLRPDLLDPPSAEEPQR